MVFSNLFLCSLIINFPDNNDENLPTMFYENNCSLSKLKRSVSKNDRSPLRSTKCSNNLESCEIVKETDICEPSPDSHDASTPKSDHNNDLRINKQHDSLDRPTSSKSKLKSDHNNDLRINKQHDSVDRPSSSKTSLEGILILLYFCGNDPDNTYV